VHQEKNYGIDCKNRIRLKSKFNEMTFSAIEFCFDRDIEFDTLKNHESGCLKNFRRKAIPKCIAILGFSDGWVRRGRYMISAKSLG